VCCQIIASWTPYEKKDVCAWDSRKVRIILKEMSEDKNFTEVCSMQNPPPRRTVWSTFRVHTSKWIDLTHSLHSMHIFQKAKNLLQLSGQITLQGGRAWRYTAVRNTIFRRQRWPLWELFSCREQTCSSKHPIANIAWRWLSETWQGGQHFEIGVARLRLFRKLLALLSFLL